MQRGTMAASSVTPWSGAPVTTTSPCGSTSAAIGPSSTSTRAPMAVSTSRMPVRPGLSPIPRQRTRQRGRAAASAMKNAAELMSPGTRRPNGSRRAGRSVTDSPSASRSAAHARRRRSVWSRVGSGSWITVGPCAFSAARRMADFTCALATSRWWTTPRGAAVPCTCMGA